MTPIFSKSTPKNHPKTVEKSPVHQKVNKSQSDPRLPTSIKRVEVSNTNFVASIYQSRIAGRSE